MAQPESSAPPESDEDREWFLSIANLVSRSAGNDIDRKIEATVQEKLRSKVEKVLEKSDMTKMTAMHLAAFEGRRDVMEILATRPIFLSDINAVNAEGRTPLHMASLNGKWETVEFLMGQPKLRGAVEDSLGQTAYEIAVELDRHDIVRAQLQHPDVANYLKERRGDRNVYAGGTNAILVGAALVASITFAGWLQPPLGYQSYYQFPRNATMRAAPPDDFEQYAAITEHLSVKIFWISNSLSFYCAIGAILAGAGALVPRGGLKELAEVRRLRGGVHLAGFALSWAVVFVVVAFTAAGFASLPPILKYEVYMIVTLVLGLLICLHGFSSARISDPLMLTRYSAFIDPAFYISKLSGLLERCCECFPSLGYLSYESRIRRRKERYNPKSVNKAENSTNDGAQQDLNSFRVDP